jgi:hypothetical protein
MGETTLGVRVICVRTGTKYDQWYVDNLKHMIDTYSGLTVDEFCVIENDIYDDVRGVFNKLQMFDLYRDKQNIYFDLDVLIKGDCNHLLRKDFTLCHAWWREAFHTPLNSSIVSWEGDISHIHDFFLEDPEYYMFYYNRGIDQFIFENFKYETYSEEDKYCSYQTILDEQEQYSVYLFNQRHQSMAEFQWFQKYFLPRGHTAG